jgi:PKD repeat protein
VSFLEGIDIEDAAIGLSAGIFVSSVLPVFLEGLDTGDAAAEISSGAFVASSSAVFSPMVFDIGDAAVDAASLYVASEPTKMFTRGAILYVYAQALLPNENGVLFVVGLLVDFEATPLVGVSSLAVQFSNLCGGPIEEYYWSFNDGGFSRATAPLHVFKEKGLYDITLRIRVEGQYHSYTRHRYVRVYPGGLVVSRTNNSFRFGVQKSQGIGFSKNSGSFPMPDGRVSPIEVYDENNNPCALVIDAQTGLFVDISPRQGPANSGLIETFKDLVEVDGSGGVDYSPSVKFPGDTGTYQHYWLDLRNMHLYTSPVDDGKRNADGYDENGYPDGLLITVSVLADGNQTDVVAAAADIVLPKHEITFDKTINHVNEIQTSVSANMGAIIIAGRHSAIVASDVPDSPDQRIMTEQTHQEAFSSPQVWAGIYCGKFVNRANLSTIIDAPTVCADPLGFSNAVRVTQPLNVGAVSGNGSALVWAKGAITMTIGGQAQSLISADYDALSGYTLYFLTSVLYAGDLVVIPSTSADLFDVRVFSTILTVADVSYYFNDAKNNGGNIMFAGL